MPPCDEEMKVEENRKEEQKQEEEKPKQPEEESHFKPVDINPEYTYDDMLNVLERSL